MFIIFKTIITKLQYHVEQVRRQENGVTLIYLALVLMVLIGFAGIAIDGSNVYMQRRRMQTAADAAALAGARSMALMGDNTQVAHDLERIAHANGAGDKSNNVKSALLEDNTTVSVNTSETFPTYFAKLFNFNDFTVGAAAKAEYAPVKKMNDFFPLGLPCDCVDFGHDVTFENTSNDSALEFCPVNLNIKPGQQFNIRDYVHYIESAEPVDWTKVVFTYADYKANDQVQPADWHLSDFNNALAVTVSTTDAAAGTGNHGAGRYRIYVARTGQTKYDGYMTIRVQNSSSNISSAKCPAPHPSTNQCKFTWLDWDGAPTTDDELFQNFADYTRSGPWQIGDWMPSGPTSVTNFQCVDRLDQAIDRPVHIPLYDEKVTDGSHNSSTSHPVYHVCGFAEFVLKAYDFNTNPKWLSGEFVPAVVQGIESAKDTPDYGMRSIHLIQ
jgi:Flp pilus assembly protein TadG